MGRKKDRRTYIRKVARTTMGQLKIDPTNYFSFDTVVELAQKLNEEFSDEIYSMMQEQSDGTCGKIMACGVPNDPPMFDRGTSLWQVHGQQWLDGRCPGADLLHYIAATALVAAICDVVIEQHPLSHRLRRYEY